MRISQKNRIERVARQMAHKSGSARKGLRGEVRWTGQRPAPWTLCRALARLERRCYPPRIAFSAATLAQWLRAEDSLLLVLWREREPVACLVSELRPCHIVTIDVAPGWRRQGLGRRLLRDALFLLRRRGCRRVLSEVATDNTPSLKLHQSFGFRTVSRMAHYYADGRDAFLLVWDAPKPR